MGPLTSAESEAQVQKLQADVKLQVESGPCEECERRGAKKSFVSVFKEYFGKCVLYSSIINTQLLYSNTFLEEKN